MKAVFSYWSKPSKDSLHRTNGGFYNQHYANVSWRLSTLLAKQWFDSVELITDDNGYAWLVDELGLDFDYVDLSLNEINHIPSDLWAFGKFVAYTKQYEPFIHLDNDVYLLKDLTTKARKADVFVQCKESFDKFRWAYDGGLTWLTNNAIELPPELKYFHEMPIEHLPFEVKYALNTGIIGGNNPGFIRKYAESIMQFFNTNLDSIKAATPHDRHCINFVIEQYYFAAICYYYNVMPHEYIDFHDKDTHTEKGFVHLLGGAKGQEDICKKMEITYNKLFK